jgi:DNA (cytosine-5)-methyltransferase 1
MKLTKSFLKQNIKVVDLFCGIGGLTHGLVLEGLDVVAGVDNDGSCQYAFEKNNNSSFIKREIKDFSSQELKKIYGKVPIKVLVGCAPCQPFSSLNKNRTNIKESRKRWEPLYKFMSLIEDVLPEIISMENVPDLSEIKKYPVFTDFLENLQKLKYKVSYRTVDVSKYGVPQRRKRLVLLASRFGSISLIPETHDQGNLVTVRDAISHLKPIKDGSVDLKDPLHRTSKLSDKNKERIIATPKNGGSATSWGIDLIPECYKKESGKSYMTSVYGRMRWDDPSPTMTTQCVTLGTGRFGHPTQNRAISLREAAIFQSFPESYQFDSPDKISIVRTAKHIGNAVPVLLGRTIGRSIKKHILEHHGAIATK